MATTRSLASHAHGWTRQTRVALHDAEWIGADMDHTLARYKLGPFTDLLVRCYARFLTNECGFAPERLVHQPPAGFAGVARGVVLDFRHGTAFHLDAQQRVQHVYHGLRELDADTVLALYPERAVPTSFTPVRSERFWPLSTFFDSPLARTYASLMVGKDVSKPDVEELEEIRQAFLRSMMFNFGSYGSGYFYPEMQANPDKYLYKRADVRQWLESVRSQHGKRVFFITNSLTEFADLLMSHAYGSDWRALFDVVVTSGRKPGFFTSPDTEFGVCATHGKADAPLLDNVRALTGGGAASLLNVFCAYDKTDAAALPGRVVYFGDHPVGDVVAPKQSQWRTVAIVEEIQRLDERQGDLPDDHPSQVLQHSFLVDQLGRDTYWGSLVHQHADAITHCMSALNVDQDILTIDHVRPHPTSAD